MEENKYYTPSIEDLCIGLEYQYFKSNGAGDFWLDDKITSFDEIPCDGGVEERLSNGEVRIKYLDKEDVESLGFKEIEPFTDNSKFKKPFMLRGAECELIFIHNKVNQHSLIKIRHEKGDINYFCGKIKNKSELKKILKMTGIC
jgi:hypothetical protein